MDRNNLLENIQWTKDVVLELEGVTEKHRGLSAHQHSLLNYKPFEGLHNPLMLRFYVVPILFIVITLFILGDLLASLFIFIDAEGIWMFLSGITLFIVLPLAGYFLLLRTISNYLIRKSKVTRIEEAQGLQSSIESLHKTSMELKNSLAEHSAVPQSYLFPYAVSKLESFLVKHRADTLKECINLYEQEEANEKQQQEAEKRHQEQLREMERQNQKMVKAVNKVKTQVEKNRDDYFHY
ncbi:hypothetical protein GJU40_11810 [Bacillus lacus]|uniref:Uncharacterized protein n=1 Tax=Metabacillus lacus TaxID=1983721 RepID=A0A7X2M088_9BACI|nr:hypothetical protein [Metabacillus lacus]MRX72832.1 hypothetical protein [Metabacillus lacus]